MTDLTEVSSNSSIRRYTNLAQALYVLKHHELILMNPSSWDDKNDAFYLSEYMRLKNAGSVAALCFASCGETFHHWRVFSGGSDGVCIHFNRRKLIESMSDNSELCFGDVSYKTFNEMKEMEKIRADDLPFLKRRGYSDEKEFRILFTSRSHGVDYPKFRFDIEAVTRVAIGPWINNDYFSDVKAVIKETGIPTRIPVHRSTLTGNRTWQEFARSATP